MDRVKKFFNDHQVFIPFIIIGIVTGLGFHTIQSGVKDRDEQICRATLENRIVIEDLINFNTPDDLSTLPPEYQEFLNFANERLDTVPDICNDTGITKEQVREDLKDEVN